MARVRVWSNWSNEAHRLVNARPVQSASCMLHAASIPRGTFLFTFSCLCWTRYTFLSYDLAYRRTPRRIHRLMSFVRLGFLGIGVRIYWDLGQFVGYCLYKLNRRINY